MELCFATVGFSSGGDSCFCDEVCTVYVLVLFLNCSFASFKGFFRGRGVLLKEFLLLA